MSNEIRIYVADLAAYNNGKLHGVNAAFRYFAKSCECTGMRIKQHLVTL